MRKELSTAVESALVELASRLHETILFSLHLNRRNERYKGLETAASSVSIRHGLPHRDSPSYNPKARQYLDTIADLLLRLIPRDISQKGLTRARETAKYFGVPMVNERYPRLAEE